MSETNRDGLLSQILNARSVCSKKQMAGMIRGLCMALGGPSMLPENRDAIIGQMLESSHTKDEDEFSEDMSVIIRVLGEALGGAKMSEENATGMFTQIWDELKKRDPHDQTTLGRVITDLGIALGAEKMRPTVRDAVFKRAVVESSTCADIWPTPVCFGFAKALGGTKIDSAHQNAMLNQIILFATEMSELDLQPASDPNFSVLANLIAGLVQALGGIKISTSKRDAIIDRIVGAHTTCIDVAIYFLMLGLADGLGGTADDSRMDELSRDKILKQIFSVPGPCSAEKMGRMIAGLGESMFANRHLNNERNRSALVAAILDAHAICSAEKMGSMAFFLGSELFENGWNFLDRPDPRKATFAQILAASGTCSGEQMGAMIWGIARAFYGAGTVKTGQVTVIMLEQILAARGTCTAEQMKEMVAGIVKAYVNFNGCGDSKTYSTAISKKILDRHATGEVDIGKLAELIAVPKGAS